MKLRNYSTYNDYLDHQKKKTLSVKDGTCHELGTFEGRVALFRGLLVNAEPYLSKSSNVLCLGARRGEEVQAFLDMGHNAIGVDLIPFETLVVAGDFHNLPFQTSDFDMVFSNAIDHVQNLPKFAYEVKRVLKSLGYALFHLTIGHWSDEMSLGLDSVDEFLRAFDNGFCIVKSHSISDYGGGLNWLIVLQKEVDA